MKKLSEIIILLSEKAHEGKIPPKVHRTFYNAYKKIHEKLSKAYPAYPERVRREALNYAYERVEADHGEEASDSLQNFHSNRDGGEE